MAISFVAEVSGAGSATSVTLPTVLLNDVGIADIIVYDNASVTISSAPSGWAYHNDHVQPGSAGIGVTRVYRYWKALTAAESGTSAQWLNSGGNYEDIILSVFRGVDPTSPFDTSPAETIGNSSVPSIVTGLTTATAGAEVFLMFSGYSNDAGAIASPSGYTRRSIAQDTVNSSYSKNIATASAVGTITATNSSDWWVCLVDVLKPAGGGPANLTRDISSTITNTVTIARAVANKRSTSATVASTVTIARVAARARAINSTIGHTMTLARLAARARAIALSIDPTVTVSRQVANARGLASTIGNSSTMARAGTFARGLASSIANTLSLSRIINGGAAAYTRDIASSIANTVTIARQMASTRGLSSTIANSLSLARVAARARAISLSIGATVTIARSAARVRGIASTIGHTLSLSRLGGFLRGIASTIGAVITIAQGGGTITPIVLSLGPRSFTLTLEGRSLTLSLGSRSFTLTLPDREGI